MVGSWSSGSAAGTVGGSGTRSSIVWALGESGMSPDEIIAAGARGGYDLFKEVVVPSSSTVSVGSTSSTPPVAAPVPCSCEDATASR